jgi:hypothetical protein
VVSSLVCRREIGPGPAQDRSPIHDPDRNRGATPARRRSFIPFFTDISPVLSPAARVLARKGAHILGFGVPVPRRRAHGYGVEEFTLGEVTFAKYGMFTCSCEIDPPTKLDG